MTIEMSTRNTTLYSTKRADGEVYETFEYEKAQQMLTFTEQGLFATECAECKAVIPVALVDLPQLEVKSAGGHKRIIPNACPHTTSVHMRGHVVPRKDYQVYEAQKASA